MLFDSEFTNFNTDTMKWVTVPEITKIADQLVARYKHQSEQQERLYNENKKLKEGIWEKEELARLKKENEKLKTEMRYAFTITPKQQEKINEWKKTYKEKYTGAIGGQFEYRFFPTSIGCIGEIIDTLSGEKFKFSELD